MKTKLILICLLFSLDNIQAQETDSLWNIFLTEFNNGILIEREKAYTINYYDNVSLSKNKIVKLLTNTSLSEELMKRGFSSFKEIQSSAIEERALEYMHQNCSRDSLPNIRDFIGKIFHEVARCSYNASARKKAIGYLFDCYMEPKLYGLWLKDFDDILKQKLMKQYTRQFTEEELSFFAESYVKYWMRYDKKVYDYIIADTIKKYQNTISYEEAKEKIFRSEVSEYKRKIKNALPSNDLLINAAHLNIKEVIPYLEEYANNEKYDDQYKKYAVCALSYMRVSNYEERVIKYFEGDNFQNDTELAAYTNNQKIWYVYIQRIQSQKYIGKCPVAYRTINDLVDVLQNFPKRYPYKGELVTTDENVPPLHEPTPFLIPEDCDFKKTAINEEVIKIVMDWMEANKGKYELRQKIDRTF